MKVKTVDKKWLKLGDRVTEMATKISQQFKIDYSFELEAQNIFYHNFEKYYNNDDEYLRFLYKSLYNRAKNFYLTKKRQRKCVSEIVDDSGNSKNIFDMMPTKKFNPISEVIVSEIAALTKKHLNEEEYLVYQQIVEGWEDRDIAFIFDCSKNRVTSIRQKIQKIISYSMGETVESIMAMC